MQSGYHALIGAAARIPIIKSKPILSFGPVILPSTNRPVPLEIRVTVPAIGNALPIILLSHGHGPSNWLSSVEGYAPLFEFYAAHGFAVLFPTHLSSRYLGLNDPDMHWKSRPADMVQILDNLDAVEEAVPGLSGRLDRSNVAVVGHSFGGWTASQLLGASNTDPRDGTSWHQPEKRIKCGVILAGVGNGGDDLSETAKKSYLPWYGGAFTKMKTPALVVYGDQDIGLHLTNRGADWHADPYTHGPGRKDLLEITGGMHGLGGISGWDAKETREGDGSPEMLGIVQRMTWAYLRSQLVDGDAAWTEACKAFGGMQGHGKVESKQ
jgi:dienelactone hydrolase